jgi:hypothetical protein
MAQVKTKIPESNVVRANFNSDRTVAKKGSVKASVLHSQKRSRELLAVSLARDVLRDYTRGL